MVHLKQFVCNPYQENTYLLYDDQGNCAIIDPGMYGQQEEIEFLKFIREQELTPTLLLNTHCHIDHVLGNHFVHEHFGLFPQFHEGELPLLIEVQNYAPQMGIRYETSPIADQFLGDTGSVSFGEEELQLILVPGHSPAHLCFYHKKQKFVIGGDALFKGSIGRTDLPGGNHDQLLTSIREKLYSLPDDITVYPGHGPSTTIGEEKRSNPFVRG
jgi:hydroxyacylglutathione hydrolase